MWPIGRPQRYFIRAAAREIEQPSYNQLPLAVDEPLEEEEPHATDHRRSLRSRCSAAFFVLCFGLVVFAAGIILRCQRLTADWSSQAESLADFGGQDGAFQANDLTAQPSAALLGGCQAHAARQTVRAIDGKIFVALPAREALPMLYRCSRVPGVFEQVPWPLRGVFWLRGSDQPDELAVLQLGAWFEDKGIFLMPFAPFMWAWSARSVGGSAAMERYASHVTGMRYTVSFRFRPCPQRGRLPWPLAQPGQTCGGVHVDGWPAALRYAEVQRHVGGDLRLREAQDSEARLEASPEAAVPGALWRRRSYEAPAWLGGCKCFVDEDSEVVKVIDEHGLPLEPYHSEFLGHIGNSSVLLWAGVTRRGG